MLIPFNEAINALQGKPISGIIHAGAHLGEEAAAYVEAKVEKVLWIEGNPDLIPELTQHVSQWGHDVAWTLVGADDGACVFNIANNGQSSSILALGTHSEKHPEVVFTGTKQVHVRRIDDVAKEFGAIGYNILNLDLQGYELEALKGSEETLAHIDLVYTEINVDELYVGCALLPQLDSFLGARGFERIATAMAGSTGWGDAVFLRRP